MTEVDIRATTSVPCAGGVLRFDPDSQVTLVSVGGSESRTVVTGLELSNFVEIWCGDDWACFLGLKGKTVWCAWPETGKLAQVSRLNRLDLQNYYDPGGLHRVEFHELTSGDLLIVYELGLARVRPDGTLCWQQVHDQLTAHLEGFDDDFVRFRGEYERFCFNLVDGRPVIQ